MVPLPLSLPLSLLSFCPLECHDGEAKGGGRVIACLHTEIE